jgi:hypothetical protein
MLFPLTMMSDAVVSGFAWFRGRGECMGTSTLAGCKVDSHPSAQIAERRVAEKNKQVFPRPLAVKLIGRIVGMKQ